MPSHFKRVPGRPDPDVYGHIEFFDGIRTRRLSISVGASAEIEATSDIVLDRNGWVLKHPFDHPRESTEEERAAVGWTW